MRFEGNCRGVGSTAMGSRRNRSCASQPKLSYSGARVFGFLNGLKASRLQIRLLCGGLLGSHLHTQLLQILADIPRAAAAVAMAGKLPVAQLNLMASLLPWLAASMHGWRRHGGRCLRNISLLHRRIVRHGEICGAIRAVCRQLPALSSRPLRALSSRPLRLPQVWHSSCIVANVMSSSTEPAATNLSGLTSAIL